MNGWSEVTTVACRPRDNPFRTERLDRLGYREAATGVPAGRADLDALIDRFERLGRRAAVIGPEGSGKTTLLDALEPRLAGLSDPSERGLEVRRLRAVPGGGALQPLSGRRGLEDVDPRTLLVVDGIDRLPVAARWRVRRAARRAGGLLVTAHRRLLLPTLVACSTTPALLGTLVDELTDGAPPRTLPAPEALHARHRGNLRTALLELFDLCAGR